MSWEGSLRRMVLEDFVEAARLRGAHSADDDDDAPADLRSLAPRREPKPGRRRRIVTRRAA